MKEADPLEYMLRSVGVIDEEFMPWKFAPDFLEFIGSPLNSPSMNLIEVSGFAADQMPEYHQNIREKLRYFSRVREDLRWF
jgi:hypothetical protein